MVKEILGTSKLTYKFQVTVPKEVRKRFGFKHRDILIFVEEHGKLVVTKNVTE